MSTTARKRLLKDFKRLQHEPPPGIQVRARPHVLFSRYYL